MSDLQKALEQAAGEGDLLDSSVKNIFALLKSGDNPIYRSSIEELVAAQAWAELNDRFFKTLAFGTGGLRGRSIGRVITEAEQGKNRGPCPENPCVGTNAMNFYNISKATQALVNYLKSYLAKSPASERPSLCIAHDTRYFSREFAELAARVASQLGCNVFLFEATRSTPELSFAVRHTGSTAGVVITASHNPPHDNGYKVYFSDGAQVVEPHASSIIGFFNDLTGESYEPLPAADQGKITPLAADFDEIYKVRLRTLVLQPEIVTGGKDLRIVFTPIHGTGAVISVPVLRDLGFEVATVEEQMRPDGGFPTVKSPNPENAEALSHARQLADSVGADLVVATDPDCDRMGVAVRNRAGNLVLLTGNQIGSLLAYYRIYAYRAKGILTDSNESRCVIIKTLVTTDLQKAIAEEQGLRCVETLTGFKYIGEKLAKYEQQLPEAIRQRYRSLSEEETRHARLDHSSFFVFGGEESYGYSGADFVRDKDANAATIMFAEVAAYAKSSNKTVDELLDEIYLKYGYYLEKGDSLVFEGAAGSEKIRQLAESYKASPPTEIDGTPVSEVIDFSEGGIRDAEGDILPKEKMTMFLLTDGRRIAVRPSGTEPKIKFYLFGRIPVENSAALPAAKTDLSGSLSRLWEWLRTDAVKRVGK
ncbi:MAG: phospho-sugar mutase [Verrucomicrobia bacterium]|nr:phospho-sugar mutase [Verrucomicrobiota bacterium]